MLLFICNILPIDNLRCCKTATIGQVDLYCPKCYNMGIRKEELEMNKRIAELYDQAIIIENGGDYVCGELDPEKFANLIVAECAEIALVDGQATGNFELFNKISRHFGVK